MFLEEITISTSTVSTNAAIETLTNKAGENCWDTHYF